MRDKMIVKEGFIKTSLQDQILYLVKIKGMTKKDAVAELETILRVKLPEEIIERLEV